MYLFLTWHLGILQWMREGNNAVQGEKDQRWAEKQLNEFQISGDRAIDAPRTWKKSDDSTRYQYLQTYNKNR